MQRPASQHTCLGNVSSLCKSSGTLIRQSTYLVLHTEASMETRGSSRKASRHVPDSVKRRPALTHSGKTIHVPVHNSSSAQELTNKLLGSLVRDLAAKHTPCSQHAVELLELRLVVAQLDNFPELASLLNLSTRNVVDIVPATLSTVAGELRRDLLGGAGEKVIVERDLLLDGSGTLLLLLAVGWSSVSLWHVESLPMAEVWRDRVTGTNRRRASMMALRLLSVTSSEKVQSEMSSSASPGWRHVANGGLAYRGDKRPQQGRLAADGAGH